LQTPFFNSTLCTVETEIVESRETTVSQKRLWKNAKLRHSGLLKKIARFF